MTFKSGKIRLLATVFSVLGVVGSATIASAQEQIRLNPNYKAQDTEAISTGNNNLISSEFSEEFNQFLSTSDDDGQYILLKDPEEGNKPLISLNPEKKQESVLRLNQNYTYTPSLSFGITDALAGSVTPSLSSQTFGGSELVLSVESAEQNDLVSNNAKAFSFRVGSSFMRTAETRYAMLLNNEIFSQQAYNLSLGVGYSGFKLGASFSRNDNVISADLSGYDIGLGYTADNWSATLNMGEYNRASSILLNSEYDVFNSISAYQLGAAYRLFPNISLTGRFTYYSYGSELDSLAIEDVKSLMFGTNLSF